MKIFANAKVNLALDVLKRLDNGYHELDMIMAPISLADEIDIEPSSMDGHTVEFDGMVLDENNTVLKTLRILEERFGLKNSYKIRVKKNIPSQAGLAGGSADAAAVLKAVIQMENIAVSRDELMEIAALIGADVPFCVENRWARVKGFGEIVEPIDTDFAMKVLLVKPYQGISTPACFALWDELEEQHYDIDIVEDALKNENIDLLYQTMENALEEAAMEIEPVVYDLSEDMLNLNLVRVLMTGSGSALMGFSVDEEVLQEAYKALKDQVEFAQIVLVGRGSE